MIESTNPGKYDMAIVGGGLAGLALSIQLAKEGFSVVLLEKEKYPFHRVCGEYISFESWNFLEELGVPLSDWDLPLIKQVMVSAPNGNSLEQPLPLGGFGISRYTLDHYLYQIAVRVGVTVLQESKVEEVVFENGGVGRFSVSYHSASLAASPVQVLIARMVCGCYGKRSNLDVKWKREFVQQKPNKLNNYIGVKYHVRYSMPDQLIALHNFSQGYCGISRVEDNRYCLCYLTTANNLKKSNNSIDAMESSILQQNPHLNKIFSEAEFLFQSPVTIAQISFAKKSLVEDHVLMLGDAAGMITPLCGNGMSMALHASKLAFEFTREFLAGAMNRDEMEIRYQMEWKKHFARRLQTGRFIQSMFGKTWTSNVFIRSMKPFPKLTRSLIRQTHGEPF